MNTNTINNKTQEACPANSTPTPDLGFLTAWNLVASGNLDEAEHFLRKRGGPSPSHAALDLLARIAMQKGRFKEAGQLWKAILEKDPNHEVAKAAIERLSSPWIAIALIKRVAALASFAIIFSLSIVGLFALFNVNHQSQLWNGAQGVLSRAISRPPEKHDKINTPSKLTNRGSQTGAASMLEQMSMKSKRSVDGTILSFFSVPGCSVNINQGETRIVFDDGLFTLGCKLKNSAKKQLSTFARLLQENSPNCQIIIEGHTDSYPMRENSLYKDNYALGLQRALTVAEVLKSHHQIAGGRILVTSMGDTNPPFPGVDYESKLKNRTIVIRFFKSREAEETPKKS